MKRSIIYLGLLILMLVIAQFYQMVFGAQVFASEKITQNTFVYKNKDRKELLNELEYSYPFSLQGQDTFSTLKQDLYLLTNLEEQQITWLEVLEDSPGKIDSIRFNKYQLPLNKYPNLTTNSGQVVWMKKMVIKNKGEVTLLSKQDFYKTVLKADKVHAMVKQRMVHEPISWFGKLFFSPIFGFLSLTILFFAIWGIDKLSKVIGAVCQQPKWLLTGIVFSLFVLWDTARLTQIHYVSLIENYLEWPSSLTWQIIVSLLFIPGYFLFFYLKRNYTNKLNFADGEAIKFAYIFTLWSVFNLLHSYFGSQVYNYLSDDIFTRVGWLSGQIPAFALMLATGNFLNNFRMRYYKLKGKEKALASAQKNELASEAELAALQSRINPHFLYNALNSIASLASEDAVKTEKMTLALSKFYKYSTNRKEEFWTTVGEELEALTAYLAVEEVRFGDQLKVSYECPENVKTQRIPRLLLQPLVENAIKYGYEAAAKKINVFIVIIQKKKQLVIKILDNGQPFSENMELGYGLRSVQKKLKLLYPNHHELDFENEPEKGVIIRLNNIEK